MKFWMTTLFFNLIIPMTIFFFGIWFTKKASPTISWSTGYRTERSMKNQETWQFAQQHFGSACKRLGAVYTILIVIAMFCVCQECRKVIGMVGTIIGFSEGALLIYLLYVTERALKKKYGV